ncbi:hypothetical protein VNO77_10146 [Canavalia gladiata]|uniref:Uncharacterized protein n=1 Tax=Canavalia gladiata TaxID=3824 RepID=A0AAN9MFJ5_CANGL
MTGDVGEFVIVLPRSIWLVVCMGVLSSITLSAPYGSRDEVSMLTIDASDSKRSILTKSWASTKFEDVQSKLF